MTLSRRRFLGVAGGAAAGVVAGGAAWQSLVRDHVEQARAAVDAIGFPDQSRSHFAALDTWWAGAPRGTEHTGWLGRWLDATAADAGPSGRPAGAGDNPLRAVSLQGGSPALLAEHARPTVIHDPRSFVLRTPKNAPVAGIVDAFRATAGPLHPDPLVADAQGSMVATVEAVDLLRRVAESFVPPPAPGAQPTAPAPKKGRVKLLELLETAAGIIDLRVGTQIIVVNLGGFDTHADQARRHDELLTELAEGLAGFATLLEARGETDRVLVLTTSEFGRRVAENGSGTDHGQASVQFLTGGHVAGGQIVGQGDLAHLDGGDLRTEIDARSLYAVALDWLSADTALTDAVLGGPYDRHQLLVP